MRYHIIFLLLLCAARPAAGQSLADLERQLDSLLNREAVSEVVIGLGFGNNPAYGGKSTDPFRPITMKPFLSPNLSYNHKSGLFASAYAYYLLNAERKPWFEMDLSAGYDYTKNRHFLTGISYTRYFYADSSDIPATPITNEAFAYFFYRKWWLEPGLSLDLGWGKYREKLSQGAERTITGSDFNIIADVRHSFIYMDLLKADDAILIMPVASFTMGTANYYSNLKSTKYVSRSKMIEKRNNRKRGNQGRPQQEEEEITVSDNTGFRPRAVDLGVRISYLIGKVAVSPSYTVFKLLQGGDTGLTGYFTASVSVTL
ncbi:hypothetical protein DLD77_01040 [Chitinophaga alhagiae]|uniref:Outer membrane protein beta-barrel domain-containing protein n=1 Tax=Chitinophaga alhagiae TaxID=2203219 RepID=A0ABM6W927_9BACT|nr:hypothetical protein [Chitinophaga alhagiae]AWO00390.1 hypothetical protein DLD77_01040 [Chitinophaga alhagiae]